MKIQDEDLNKVTGGNSTECKEANFGKEIPGRSLNYYKFKNVYCVDRKDNTIWIKGVMIGKINNTNEFTMKVEETCTGSAIKIGRNVVHPDAKNYDMEIDGCKFYEAK